MSSFKDAKNYLLSPKGSKSPRGDKKKVVDGAAPTSPRSGNKNHVAFSEETSTNINSTTNTSSFVTAKDNLSKNTLGIGGEGSSSSNNTLSWENKFVRGEEESVDSEGDDAGKLVPRTSFAAVTKSLDGLMLDWSSEIPAPRQTHIQGQNLQFVFSAPSCEPLSNQRVVHHDAKRTRAGQVDQERLETLLKNYCNATGTYYRQGLNEILAPFTLLEPVDDAKCLMLFHGFFSAYCAPFFEEDDFTKMENTLDCFSSLLMYHFPKVHHVLASNDLPPVIYATPWFLTLFSSKLESMADVLKFWKMYCIKAEPHFCAFIGLALFKKNEESFLSQPDPSVLPGMLTNLRPHGYEEIDELYVLAEELFQKTPWAFKEALLEKSSWQGGEKLRLEEVMMETVSDDMPATVTTVCGLTADHVFNMMTHYHEHHNSRGAFSKSNSDSAGSYYEMPLVLIDTRDSIEYEAHGRFPCALNCDIQRDPLAIYKIFGENSGATDAEKQVHLCITNRDAAYKCALEYQIPYVSFLRGGYKKLHDLALRHERENSDVPCRLIGHDPTKCKFCRSTSSMLMAPLFGVYDFIMSGEEKTTRVEKYLNWPVDGQEYVWRCKTRIKGTHGEDDKLVDTAALVTTDTSMIFLVRLDSRGKSVGNTCNLLQEWPATRVAKITSKKKTRNTVGAQLHTPAMIAALRFFYFKPDEKLAFVLSFENEDIAKDCVNKVGQVVRRAVAEEKKKKNLM